MNYASTKLSRKRVSVADIRGHLFREARVTARGQVSRNFRSADKKDQP